jgi:hypothetical protein
MHSTVVGVESSEEQEKMNAKASEMLATARKDFALFIRTSYLGR